MFNLLISEHDCQPEDYKLWSPHAPNHTCLLGREEVFERRIAHTSCYSGVNYERPVKIENCPCDREDYEWYIFVAFCSVTIIGVA